ncbi:alkaline phosphatase family protein [bacterium]|nr:alkaline phosphatase family protein [bacterium]
MSLDLTYFAATVSRLLQIEPPALAAAGVAAEVIAEARSVHAGAPVQRLLVYAPDAIGVHLADRCTADFALIRQHAPVEVELYSVMPSITPVCFASLFTGAAPSVHGYQAYEKPIVRCDTIFDALLRAGKRVAIVTVQGSSIDLMYRERELDYFSEQYDPQVTKRALKLMEADKHDFILAYHQQYDDLLHQTEPFSAECLAACRSHAAGFARLAQAAAHYWQGYRYALAVTPDHGAHLDKATGRGTHGSDLPADQALKHFWGFGNPA